MKMTVTAEGVAARARGRRARLDGLVAEMHAFYMAGHSLHETGKKFGDRTHGAVRELFALRGLYVRPFKTVPRQANGAPVRRVPLTAEQLDALVAAATRIGVPDVLKAEWRKWSLARRGEFIARIRAKLASKRDRPTGAFSANVEPFDYATPRAHAIERAMNVGLSSRAARVKIKVGSQGVIWRDGLFFWVGQTGYVRGPWTPEGGRPALHHLIWEDTHGQPVPAGHVVRFADGNCNNHAPENLVLQTRNDVCRENHSAALTKKSRQRTTLLLNRSTKKDHHHALSNRLLTASR